MTNKFKGLELIECLKNYGQRFVTLYKEAAINTISKKKKCKKAQWLSEEALQIVGKRTKAKSKGEKGRRTHLNAEFQTIARSDKKAFLCEHCKEIEENSKMGQTRDLFKKIKRYQGNISCEDGHSKGQKWYEPYRS